MTPIRLVAIPIETGIVDAPIRCRRSCVPMTGLSGWRCACALGPAAGARHRRTCIGTARLPGGALNAHMRHSTIPRMGASFDFEIVGDCCGSGPGGPGPGILECKNVDWLRFRDGWVADAGTGAIEAPAHIETQVQHQLAVSGRAWAEIAVHVGGNDLKILHRPRDVGMVAMPG